MNYQYVLSRVKRTKQTHLVELTVWLVRAFLLILGLLFPATASSPPFTAAREGRWRNKGGFNQCVIRKHTTESNLSLHTRMHSLSDSNYLLCEQQQLVSLLRAHSALFCPWTHSWEIREYNYTYNNCVLQIKLLYHAFFWSWIWIVWQAARKHVKQTCQI